jgi:hypothetical protein
VSVTISLARPLVSCVARLEIGFLVISSPRIVIGDPEVSKWILYQGIRE